MDPLFPFIQVPPPASHGASATQAYYKALETGAPHSGRRVKIDYSQSANPGDKNKFGRPAHSNDGTRDIGNSQSPILLFRGLDPLSGPQAICQAMKGSSGVGKEGAKGMKRIILIKDKVTMSSWGFAFVEFVDVQVILSSKSVLCRHTTQRLLFTLASRRQRSWPLLCLHRYIQMDFASPSDPWRRPLLICTPSSCFRTPCSATKLLYLPR